MGIYRDLGRNPGVFRILLAQLTARFPGGMLSITLLLHVQLLYGNYTSAGIALAGLSIGMAISGPVSGRLMGTFGMRPVLTFTTAVSASLLILVALTQLPLAVVTILSFMIGLTQPPVMPAVRTIYPTMVPAKQVTALFSLDASAQEIIWVLGPVIAVFVSVQVSTVWGLLIAATFMVGGGIWFIASPEVGVVKIPPARAGFGAVLRYPTVVVATVVGFFFVASMAALEAGVVSVYGHESVESSIVLAIFSLGSLVGGLLFGHREIKPWSFAIRPLITIAGISACIVMQHTVWLSAMAFIAGLGVAPMFAALFTAVSASVRFSETAEAYGWLNMGQLGGAAAGSAFAGVFIDVAGPVGGIAVAASLIALTVVCSVLCVKWIPDLTERGANPIPDTEPIAVIKPAPASAVAPESA